ncbi:hypothetical protein REPUB_Repub10bG0018500 [Reevesia pubescens]
MCNTRRSRRRKRKSKSSSNSVSLGPSRKTRTKTRKPKYLSLLHLEENQPQMSSQLINNNKNKGKDQREQLNLFPLHPENLVEDRDTLQYDNVSLLFNSTVEDNVHAVTLTGLLDDESSDNYKNKTTTTTVTTTTTTTEETPLSPSLTYGYSCEDLSTRLSLVRSAMKGIRKKARDESEEKWVVYSEVVEKQEMEEVSSCGGGGGGDGGGDGGGGWCSTSKKKKMMKKLLALKLDYEEIMNAWSDKGPLYIEGESPQTVPDLHVRNLKHFNFFSSSFFDYFYSTLVIEEFIY